MRRCWPLLALLVLAPATAAADDGKEAALRLNAEAQALFEDEQYEAAAKTFAAAFATYEEPRILLGETIAWYKADNCENAVSRAERYLREAKSANEVDRANVSKIQAECAVRAGHAALERDDLAGAELELKLAERLDVHDGATESIAALGAAIDDARVEPPPEPPEVEVTERESGSTRKLLGWTLVGVGGASLIGGGALTLSYVSAVNEYEDHVAACQAGYDAAGCTVSESDLTTRKAELDQRRRNTRGPQIALLAAGGVLSTIGVVLLVWPKEGAEVALTPTSVQLRVKF